ncbi:MAG: mannose-6-phosphate isomerase [Bacilli bacterium]|nr:mannose-6-phosphate isomerase [Bacilli bacterium]
MIDLHLYPLKFKAIAQERIWGGSRLKRLFEVETNKPIGEYWVLSGYPNATSMISNGTLAGKNLNEIIAEYPQAYLGQSKQDRFPLLIKFLEAEDDLSVQIHPNDEYGLKHEGDYGKTEAWYILDSKPGGEIIYGDTFRSREQYLQAVADHNIKPYLVKLPVSADDFVHVPSQTMHALLAGTTLIEIQQTSDVTYRVYDWDRLDSSGKGRELHIEKAADVMLYGSKNAMVEQATDTKRFAIAKTEHVLHEHLVTCPYFSIEKITLSDKSYEISLGRQGNPDILVIASGEGTLEWTEKEGTKPSLAIKNGDTILIPSTISQYSISTTSKITLLKTFY